MGEIFISYFNLMIKLMCSRHSRKLAFYMSRQVGRNAWSVKDFICGSLHVGGFFLLAAMGLEAGVSFRGVASESAVLIVAKA